MALNWTTIDRVNNQRDGVGADMTVQRTPVAGGWLVRTFVLHREQTRATSL